jgi:hypothetical protein
LHSRVSSIDNGNKKDLQDMEAVLPTRGQNLSHFGLTEAVVRRLDIMAALRIFQPATTLTLKAHCDEQYVT